MGRLAVAVSSETVTLGTWGLAASTCPPKLSCSEKLPTIAKSFATPAAVNCLFGAPWKLSSALSTISLRPLIPPWALAYAAYARVPTTAPSKRPATWVETLPIDTVDEVSPVRSENADVGTVDLELDDALAPVVWVDEHPARVVANAVQTTSVSRTRVDRTRPATVERLTGASPISRCEPAPPQGVQAAMTLENPNPNRPTLHPFARPDGGAGVRSEPGRGARTRRGPRRSPRRPGRAVPR